jgi:uncharacterized alkaline shock family protein YloU
MKLIRSIIVVIFIAEALCTGILLLWAFLAEKGILPLPFDLMETVRIATSSPWNWRGGLLLVAIGGVIIWLRMIEMRREQCIAFDNPSGEVAISMDAVEDFIRRTGSEFPSVKSLEPRIHAGAEGIGISIRMDVYAGTNIPRVTEEMQNAIKERVQETLGINVAYVSVSVGQIVGSAGVGDEEKEDEI